MKRKTPFLHYYPFLKIGLNHFFWENLIHKLLCWIVYPSYLVFLAIYKPFLLMHIIYFRAIETTFCLIPLVFQARKVDWQALATTGHKQSKKRRQLNWKTQFSFYIPFLKIVLNPFSDGIWFISLSLNILPIMSILAI